MWRMFSRRILKVTTMFGESRLMGWLSIEAVAASPAKNSCASIAIVGCCCWCSPCRRVTLLSASFWNRRVKRGRRLLIDRMTRLVRGVRQHHFKEQAFQWRRGSPGTKNESDCSANGVSVTRYSSSVVRSLGTTIRDRTCFLSMRATSTLPMPSRQRSDKVSAISRWNDATGWLRRCRKKFTSWASSCRSRCDNTSFP